jgi:hypothetical protein
MVISISKAWDETRTFLARERALLYPIVLALLVVPDAVVGLIEPVAPAGEQPAPGGWMIVAAISLLLSLLGQLAIIRLALGWEGRVSDALRLAFQRLWTVLGAYLILGLVGAAIAVPLMLALGVREGASPPVGAAALVITMMILAFLLIVARFLPMAALALEEKHRPWTLLGRSWSLTQGSYWRLLGFFLIFLVGTLVLAIAVNSVCSLLFTLVLGPSEPFTVSRLLISIADGVAQGIIQTVYAVMLARIAKQLVATPGEVPRG